MHIAAAARASLVPHPPRARGAAVWLTLALALAAPARLSAQTFEAPPQQVQDQDPAPIALSSLVVRAFGSVHWGRTDEPAKANAFSLGQLDFFVTSTLSDRFSVLTEIVLEGSINTQVITDLERLQLTYRHNDHLIVSAGRYHTGIGFYNTAFHHGSFFETPIGRPRIFAFEDEGGVLPVHEVGVTVRGLVPRSKSSLNYLVEVGNGRRWDEDYGADPAAQHDPNPEKSTNVALSYRPDRWRGLEAGASFYRDTITDASQQEVAHRIFATYATYRTASVEVLAEWLVLHHRAGGVGHRNDGGYLQASKAWGKWRPYYRYDRLDVDAATPVIGDTESSAAHVVGLRVDPSEWVGLKAQYERARRGARHDVNGLGVQLVFVF